MHGRRRSLARVISLCAMSASLTANAAEGLTTEQVEGGRQAYGRYCAECHHVSLRGSAHGSALKGATFVSDWGSKSTAALAGFLRAEMSPTAPPVEGDGVYVAIAAYLQHSNGITPTDASIATAVPNPVAPLPGGSASSQTKPPPFDVMEMTSRMGRWVNRETPQLEPVSDKLLRNPKDADWLSWRRTQDGRGYSPLKQINRSTVRRLKLAWALTMREGSNQPTPLVHDGVMFLTHPGNVVQALNAATGDLIWEYVYRYPPDSRTLGGPMRNIAIYKDKIFLATYDAAVVAIDARTGKRVWRTYQGDYTKGLTHTIGPVIGGGVVISGMNGCERFNNGGCFIVGLDPDTGRELWRTSTIALPGDPNDATWGKVPPERRAGGDNWIPGTYDPDLGLFFVGTAQAKPWVAASRGMSPLDAALYTNSTLALDPRSGRMKWYFQHVPGESLDMDSVFERVLIDVGPDKYVLTIGKDGLLWKLDRRTGEFRGLVETVPQNIYSSIDHQTGRLTYRKDIIDARIGDKIAACPGHFGGHNWQASAYSPETAALITPLHLMCSEVTGTKDDTAEGGFVGTLTTVPMPGTEGKLGRLSSYDVKSLKLRWSHSQRAMFMTGVVTTAGGLAFVGDLDRYFKAFDVRNGKLLWQTRLGAPLHGYPITYAVNGKQYVAVPTGMGVFKLVTAQQSPDIYQPNGGNALYVFELAD